MMIIKKKNFFIQKIILNIYIKILKLESNIKMLYCLFIMLLIEILLKKNLILKKVFIKKIILKIILFF